MPEYDDDGKEQNIYKNYQCCRCEQFGHPPTYIQCPEMQKSIELSRRLKQERDERKIKHITYEDAPAPQHYQWNNRRMSTRNEGKSHQEGTNQQGMEIRCRRI